MGRGSADRRTLATRVAPRNGCWERVQDLTSGEDLIARPGPRELTLQACSWKGDGYLIDPIGRALPIERLAEATRCPFCAARDCGHGRIARELRSQPLGALEIAARGEHPGLTMLELGPAGLGSARIIRMRNVTHVSLALPSPDEDGTRPLTGDETPGMTVVYDERACAMCGDRLNGQERCLHQALAGEVARTPTFLETFAGSIERGVALVQRGGPNGESRWAKQPAAPDLRAVYYPHIGMLSLSLALDGDLDIYGWAGLEHANVRGGGLVTCITCADDCAHGQVAQLLRDALDS